MSPRQTLTLDGIWRFTPDAHRDGESLGFHRADRDFSRWREVRAPGCFEAGCPDLDFYEGVCWYRRTFAVPPSWRGRRIALHFEAVNYRARVWLNGQFLGEHRDGFLPFGFDLEESLRRDGANTLVVEVDNAHHEGDVPGMHVGWRGYGGILREVTVNATGPVYIERVRILATPAATGGEFEISADLRNAGPGASYGELAVEIRDAEGGLCLALNSARLQLPAHGATTTVLRGRLPGAQPWAPATPVLYQAVARLRSGDAVEDELVTPFGFRSIAATPDGLRLNGEPLFLVGFNRHEDSPRTGMATDLETTRRDLEQMKAAGANFVRLCHYPHHPAELDLCDQLGLVALCEIPLYFWNSAEEGRRTNAARATTAARQLEKMVARDRNHPSVAFWSVSNETQEDEPAVAAANRDLIRRARALDPSRLCVHVSNHWQAHPNFDEDDVVCVNSYPTMDFEGRGHNPATFDIAAAVAQRRTQLEELHRRYPTKPVLIAEFGYASFAGTFSHAFGEDEHARSLAAEFATFDAPWLCGAAIWCWADHPWPGGRFFNGLTVSPFGVVSRDRRRLKPYWAARSMFLERQGRPAAPPVWEPQGTGVLMLRPNLDAIPQVPFPDGYGIRGMTVEDIALWTDIQRDAEPYFPIGAELFRSEFGDDLGALPWRCFIVTDPKGLGVGTMSAWYNRDFHGEDWGRIHWVSVRPRCQGKGLAKAALSYAMNRLAEWHRRAYLVTSTERVGAIALYLNFGFVPDLTPANAHAAWTDLATRLQHPALQRALNG